MSLEQPRNVDAQLVRAIGVPGLAANIINTTIGAGIFVLPASVAVLMGPAAPLAFLVCALVMGLVVTSFALAGSRVSISGGLYGYVETAFGRSVGFLAGGLLFVNACLGVSSVGTAFAGFVAKVFPVIGTKPGKMALLAAVFAILAVVNIRGVKSGARVVGTVTIAKLIPLLIFVALGLFYIRRDFVVWPGWPSAKALGESALTPSGEVKNPARTVPWSLFGALLLTTGFYIAIQLVTQGVLGPDIANFKSAPLAEAATRFVGSWGGWLILIGAIVSSFGFITSDMLGSPRTIYALSRAGIVPEIFSRVHRQFRTPYVAIITYAAITFLLALSSTFEHLVILSSIPLVLLYLLSCIAAFILMIRDVKSVGEPLKFPAAFAVPLIAAVSLLWVLFEAVKAVWTETTVAELVLLGMLIAIGVLLFLFRREPLGSS